MAGTKKTAGAKRNHPVWKNTSGAKKHFLGTKKYGTRKFQPRFIPVSILLMIFYMVGGLEHVLYFCYIYWDFIIPADFHIFQRGGSITKQFCSSSLLGRQRRECNLWRSSDELKCSAPMDHGIFSG